MKDLGAISKKGRNKYLRKESNQRAGTILNNRDHY